jgi:hypothetical protein
VSFLYPSVFWFGLPVIALPAIIHLLHLRRQRKVDWPAMQFLLESQEQSRRWINLQEMLLLLLRTLAVALVVVMLAGPTTRSGWLNQFVERPVHHLLVLDDSYSMTDRWADTTAWREAVAASTDLVRAAADASQSNVVSVLMHSEGPGATDNPRPALFRRSLDVEGLTALVSRLESTPPSDKRTSLVDTLHRAVDIAQLQSPDQDLMVYLIGDFRAADLAAADEITKHVQILAETAERVRLIRCVRQRHENLALVSLEPEGGVRASGVEIWMRMNLRNYGTQVARDVIVELEQDGKPLVAVPVGDIPPGELVERKFRVAFSGEGPHWLAAKHEADAIELDNTRRFAALLPETQKVLLVDGSPGSWESYYLSTAINPGGNTKSGWNPQVIKPSQLAALPTLDEHSIVALLDVPRLTPADVARLQQYVEQGGGLYITLGESIDRKFYADELFRGGTGWLPAPPHLPTQWIGSGTTGDVEEPQPDLRVTDHPLFRIFQGQRNSMLALMRVNYYYALAGGWQSATDDNTRVIATLGRSVPLVIEKQVGEGKVVLQTTKISPDQQTLGSWSNFGANPAFVVLANDLFSYLASPLRVDQAYQVGEQVRVNASPRLFAPSGKVSSLDAERPFAASLTDVSQGEQRELSTPPLERAGMYNLSLDRLGGGTESRLVAVDVNPEEGNLELAADTTLRQKLAFDNLAIDYADQLRGESSPSESTWTEIVLVTLMLILVVEQGLAYVCSFHE